MGTYGHVAFTSVGVPMRRAAKDIHPRDFAAYVPEAKKDGTWGSVVQLYAFAAVHNVDVRVWKQERDDCFRFEYSAAAPDGNPSATFDLEFVGGNHYQSLHSRTALPEDAVTAWRLRDVQERDRVSAERFDCADDRVTTSNWGALTNSNEMTLDPKQTGARFGGKALEQPQPQPLIFFYILDS